MNDADTRQFFINYIVVASLFLLTGVILTLMKERQLNHPRQRTWKKCIYGHWATGREYCSECGLWLAPVPETWQRRIKYIATHVVTKRVIRDAAVRYHFSLWLVEREQADDFEYMLDVALALYRNTWRARALETVEER